MNQALKPLGAAMAVVAGYVAYRSTQTATAVAAAAPADKPKKMLVRRHSSGEHAWNPTRAETAAKKTAAKSMGVQKGHTQDSEVIARALPIPSPSRRISNAPN